MSHKRSYGTTFAHRDDIRVAIFCALPIESNAVERVFDEIYESKSSSWQRAEGDTNSYTTGKISGHHVVLAYLPGIGKVNATSTACNLKATFRNIELALVVGICAGSPWTSTGDAIYLGDVVISTQVLQADFGRERHDRFDMKSTDEGNLRPTPAIVRSFLSKLQGPSGITKLQDGLETRRQSLRTLSGLAELDRSRDVLHGSEDVHRHQEHNVCGCQETATSSCEIAKSKTCEELACGEKAVRTRDREGPLIHFGPVSSADTVKRNAVSRDLFIRHHKVLAFEMEAAGIWNLFPTIVIKSVCDYADSHKDKTWQPHAAINAAATCHTLLSQWQAGGATHANGVDEEMVREILSSLTYPDMNSRLASIEPAFAGTCDWVLKTEQFLAWCGSDQVTKRIHALWIKGKPGSGKSTLMRHILQRAKQFFPGHTILTFFFHARGQGLQRSHVGMLRSLTWQLLKAQPEVVEHFITSRPYHSDDEWTVEELQTFWLLAVQQRWIRETVLLIDAVDECPETQARRLISFCDVLVSNASTNGLPLRICFSIRHFPNISSKHGVILNIDNNTEHEKDLKRFVHGSIQVVNTDLYDRILKRSNHVFLWTRLVTELLNALHDRGADDDELALEIDRVPMELDSVFKLLLMGPSQPLQTGVLLLVLVSAQAPISPYCLYLLVQAATEPNKIKPQTTLRMNVDRLSAFISTVSRGLVEVVGTRSGTNQVQFIHETVRSFLTSAPELAGFGRMTATRAHQAMVDACLTSLTVSYPAGSGLEDVPHVEYALRFCMFHIAELPGDIALYLKRFYKLAATYLWCYKPLWSTPAYIIMLQREETFRSLLVFVVCLYGLDDRSQQRILNSISRIWLDEILPLDCDDKKLAVLQTLFDTVHADTWQGVRFITISLQLIAAFEDDELFSSAACYTSINNRASSLVECIKPYHQPSKAVIHHHEGITGFIVDHFWEQCRSLDSTQLSKMLIKACQEHSISAVTSLVALGANVNNVRIGSAVPLSVALQVPLYHERAGNETMQNHAIYRIAEILLESRADPDARYSPERPLHLAIQLQSPDLVELLLAYGASPMGTNYALPDDPRSADWIFFKGPMLFNAVASRSLALVQVFFSRNSEAGRRKDRTCYVHRNVKYDSDPDRRYIDFEYEIQSIDDSVDLGTRNYWGRTVLHEAVLYKSFEISRYLLKMGADPNVRDHAGRTALHYAIFLALSPSTEQDELEKIINLLLSNGADPRLKDQDEHDPWELVRLEHCDLSVRGNELLSRYSSGPGAIYALHYGFSSELSGYRLASITRILQVASISRDKALQRLVATSQMSSLYVEALRHDRLDISELSMNRILWKSILQIQIQDPSG